jgi:hypothetical protein
MSKYGSFMESFVPGAFKKSIDDSPDAFEGGDLTKLALRGDGKPFDLNNYKDLSPSQAASKYVCERLDVNDEKVPKKLAAKLNKVSDYTDFEWKDLIKLEEIPKGSVIFFTQGIGSDLMCAYATGRGKEFTYFKAGGATSPETFNLGAEGSPVTNMVQLRAAFIWSKKPETVEPAKPAEAAKPAVEVAPEAAKPATEPAKPAEAAKPAAEAPPTP